MLFGGVIALLPIFAEDILKIGPEGLGYLRAAPSIGALITMIALTRFPPTRHAWRNTLLAVAGFWPIHLIVRILKLPLVVFVCSCYDGCM